MGILKPATNTTAFLKMGLMGFAGAGKSFTAMLMALGLAKELGDGKPVAFFDTETGSDPLIRHFKAAGLQLLTSKSRAFTDLMTFMEEAEQTCSVAIIDSITHVWNEIMAAYKREYNRTYGLEFQDWGKLKPEWGRFTDAYLNSHIHVILCGRAGWEYEYEMNEEKGKKELIKTGTKMKAETEMGYEPSLLVEMVKIKRSELERNPIAKGWIHRAYVLKDRNDRMDGEEIDNPTFDDFAPALVDLNIGGEHLGVDTSRTSDGLFQKPESAIYRRRQVEITLENIRNEFVRHDLSAQSGKGRKAILEILEKCFGTGSWTAIEAMRLEDLQLGYAAIRDHFEPVPEEERSDDETEEAKDGGAN